jgi:hypothetical protein
MEDYKKTHILSAAAVKVFRQVHPYSPNSRIPLLMEKRLSMSVEERDRCDRTIIALKQNRFFK